MEGTVYNRKIMYSLTAGLQRTSSTRTQLATRFKLDPASH